MKKKYLLVISLFISSFSFSQCIHTFNMFDSFGDGWNGNAVDILVNGNTIIPGATIATGSVGVENFSANIGDTIELANWVTGSWTNEVSWDITDGDGMIIASGVHNGLASNAYGFCPTCPSPSSLGTTNLTADSATLTWIAGGVETLWNIEWGVSGFIQGTGTFDTTSNFLGYPIGSLTGSTNYDFYIQGICGLGDTSSWAGPYLFTTPCVAIVPPNLEDFSGGFPPNACWDQAGDGDPSSGPTNLGTSSWFEDGFGNVGFTGAVKVNLWLAAANEWVLSPQYDLSSGGPFQIEFDFGVFTFGQSAPGILGSDDRVEVLISRDGGGSWTGLTNYNNNFVTNLGGNHEIIPLPNDTGIVQFAFWATEGSVDDPEDNDVIFDNFEVVPIPSCPQPQFLSLINATLDSAILTWSSFGTDSLWNVYVTPAGINPDSSHLSTVNNDTVFIGGLNPSSTYDFYVQSICSAGDSSFLSGPYSFSTLCGLAIAPYSENFSTGSLPNCWTQSVISGDGWQFSGTPGYDAANNGRPAGSYAWIDFSATDQGTVMEVVSVDVSGLSVPQLEFDYFCFNTTNPITPNILYVEARNNNTWNTVDSLDINSISLWNPYSFSLVGFDSSGIVNIRFRGESGGASNDYYNDILVDNLFIREAPTCPRPLVSTISIDSITASGASISWLPALSETLWGVEWGVSGFTLGSGVFDTISNNLGYTISSLSPNTDYDFYVQAICDSVDQSYWAGPYTFTTPCGAITPPNLEGFSAGFPPDDCWDQAGDGDPSSGPSGIGTSSWFSDGFGNVGFTGAVKVNLYLANKNEWVLSPQYDLTSGGPFQIEFDFGVFTFGQPAPGILGSDDRVEVLISRDGGGSWSGLTNYNNNYTTSPGGNHEIIALPNDSGIVQFAIWATEGTVNDPVDNDVMFDNFEIVPIPSCPQPQNLNVSNILTDSATISWSSFITDSLWNVYLTPSGVSPDTSHLTIVNNDTLVISGLSAATTYDFYVQSMCTAGDSSFITGPISFTTNCTAFIAPYTQDFTQGSLPVCWSQSTITGDGWQFTGTPGYDAANNGRPAGSYAWIDFSATDQGTVMEVAPVDISSLLSPQIEFDFFCFNTTNPSPSNILFVEAFDGASWLTIDSIQDNTNQSWTTFSFPVLGFDVSGIIYLRFRGESGGATNDFYNDILVDDLTVKEGPQNDVGVIVASLPSASTGCEVDSSLVTATIFNFGYLAQSGFTIQYTLNGTPFVETVFDTLQPGDSLLYTFILPVDLTQDGTYSFDFTTNLPNDDNTANDAYGSTIEVQNYYTPVAPTVTDDTICVNVFNPNGQIATLTASGPTGVDFDWFDSNDNFIGTGDTMQTDTINTSTSVFVAYKELAPGNMGAINNTFGGGGYYNFFTEGLLFDVYSDLTIDSVTIFPDDTGTVGIIIQSILGSAIFNGTYTITSPVNTISGHKVPIGVNIPAGLGYGMYISAISPGTLSLYRNTTNASYPYDYSNVASITQASNGSTDFYYFFYNWDISTISCYSEMQEAVVYVDACLGVENEIFEDFKIYPNPNNGSFEIQMTNLYAETEIEILDLNGKVIYKNTCYNKNQNINIENISRGIYIVKATQNGNIITKKLMIN